MSLFKPSDRAPIQGVKSVVVGGIAFLSDISCLWLLTEIGRIYYLISAAIAFMVGLIVNYELSVSWVFATRRYEDRKKEFVIFCLIGIFTTVVGLTLMWLLTEMAQFHYLNSKILVTVITFFLNFSMRKGMLFTNRQTEA